MPVSREMVKKIAECPDHAALSSYEERMRMLPGRRCRRDSPWRKRVRNKVCANKAYMWVRRGCGGRGWECEETGMINKELRTVSGGAGAGVELGAWCIRKAEEWLTPCPCACACTRACVCRRDCTQQARDGCVERTASGLGLWLASENLDFSLVPAIPRTGNSGSLWLNCFCKHDASCCTSVFLLEV